MAIRKYCGELHFKDAHPIGKISYPVSANKSCVHMAYLIIVELSVVIALF